MNTIQICQKKNLSDYRLGYTSHNDREPSSLPCLHESVSGRPWSHTGIRTCSSEIVPNGPLSQHLARAAQPLTLALCPRGIPRTVDESKGNKTRIFTLR